MEKQLARDLLFRRFTGLDISESAPEHSTFWRFRQTLEKLCLMDGLLNEINLPSRLARLPQKLIFSIND
ncbi:MAG TPA: transposase [Cycloclasticus sp.]|nr:transposase [Cycloclasticus sp.]